jgi:hypothetical protein
MEEDEMDHVNRAFEWVWAFIQPALDFLRDGFNHVNATDGLVIALVAAIIMQRWGQLLFWAVIAAVVDAFLSEVLPTMRAGARFHLPPLMDQHYWLQLGAVAAGMLVVIAVLFALKTALLSLTGVGRHVGQH